MELEKDYNIHLGIVVQTNDPEMRGRVKVFIPRLAPVIPSLNENVDKFFNFIDSKNNSEFTKILDDLKKILPWAEYAGPLCGGNASGRYNAQSETGTTSDSNAWKGDEIVKGFRPVQNYIAQNTIPDAFTEVGKHKNNFVNQYAHQYTPTNYSGLARGLFSIPNVGAHIYVFFTNGDRNFPVYFASSYSQDDIKRIFTLSQDVNDNTYVDYPSTYENIKQTQTTEDSKTFRSKTVLNSNKHTIELIDTDLREILKFTHYSGSFKEFNNYSTIELATGNDQKMVMQDQFLTVTKNKSEYVGLHKELTVAGDNYINVGETDQDKVKQILELHKQFHEYKLLFDVQRAKYDDPKNYTYGNPKDMSKYQTRKGLTISTGIDKLAPLYESLNARIKLPIVPVFDFVDGFSVCPVCKGVRYNPYDVQYSESGNPLELWKEAGYFIATTCMAIAITNEVAAEAGGELGGEVPPSGSFSPECHKYYFPQVSEVEELLIPPCISVPHPFLGKVGYYAGMQCACCKGSGISPSSEGGNFNIEPAKQPNDLLDKLILSKSPELFKLEKQLGSGGDEIKTISMNKIETIGLAMNDMKSFRVDPIGKLKIDGCWVAPQKTYDNFKPSPHVEYVDVADVPGGDYILTCMNKYKLLVGARGINIETYGPIDIYGTIVNFAGEQVNISSKNEVIIDGGERLSLRARKISLLPVEHNAVVIDGQLHVTRNSILEGGIMLEGEVALLHVTAPLEWQVTEIGLYDITAGMCTGIPATYDGVTLTIPNHTHYFKNIPLTLLPNRESVRENMIQKGINSRKNIAAASPTSNPTECSQSLWNKIGSSYLPIAWAECKTQAAEVGINVQREWAQWDVEVSAGRSYNLPMTNDNTNGRVCQTETTPDGETLTTITASYIWKYAGFQGGTKVTSKVKSNGEFIERPKLA